MKTPTKGLLRRLHRWGGLLVAGFVLFYAITGILLNHRSAFSYFYRLKIEKIQIKPSDPERIKDFVEYYKSMIQRQDDPTVIKIQRNRVVEFLYGSHGLIRYTIYPEKGEIVRQEKVFLEPLNRLNNRLHKAVKTSTLWVVFSDVFSSILVSITIIGLFILRYSRVDIFLLLTGILLLGILVVIG